MPSQKGHPNLQPIVSRIPAAMTQRVAEWIFAFSHVWIHLELWAQIVRDFSVNMHGIFCVYLFICIRDVDHREASDCGILDGGVHIPRCHMINYNCCMSVCHVSEKAHHRLNSLNLHSHLHENAIGAWILCANVYIFEQVIFNCPTYDDLWFANNGKNNFTHT